MENSINSERGKRGGIHYSFLVFFACCTITGISVALYFSCNGIFYTPVSEYFGVGRGAFAVSGTIMALVLGFFSPVMGSLIEKHSFQKLLIICLVTQAAAYVIQAKAWSVYVFYATGVLHGLVHSLTMLLVVPTVINRWFDVRRGFFIGLASSMSGVGGIVWNAVAGRFLEAYGWQNTYLLYAALVALIPLPLAIFIIRDYPENKGIKPYGYNEVPGTTEANFVEGEGSRLGMTSKEAAKTFSFWMLVTMSLSINTINCFTAYIPSYATSLGLSITFGATLSSVMGFGILIGKNTTGILFDKNIYLGILTATAVPATGFILLYALGHIAPGYMAIGSLLYGISFAGNPVLLPLLIVHVFGTKEYGKILGTINMYGSVVGAAMGVIFGFISDIPDGSGFTIIIVTCATCALIAMLSGITAVKKGCHS